MESKVILIETALNRKVEEWNVEDLDKISQDTTLLKLLKDSDTIKEILSRSKANPELSAIFTPLYIKSLLTEAISKADAILEQKDSLQYDEYVKLCNSLSGNTYEKIVKYILLLDVQEFDMKEMNVEIAEVVGTLKETIEALIENNINDCYTLIVDLLNILFPLRTRYFSKYEYDLLDDEDGEFEKYLTAFHDFEMKMYEALKELDELTGDEGDNDGTIL